jgi:diguanylate cyclase (GGDEF)-like protein
MDIQSFGDIARENLERVHLFRRVGLDSILGLLEACGTRTLKEGEILLSAGQTNTSVFLILNGRIRIHLESLDTDPLAILGAGESVGEMSVLDGRPASAFAVADEACRLLVMDEDILWSLVHSSHEAACNLLYILARRLRNTDRVLSRNVPVEQVYQRYGSVDALTGLYNRSWLDDALERLCRRCSMGGIPLTAMLIDIDRFKEFNDRHGRLSGDRILHSMARILAGHLRPSEPIARYGTDSFVIILPHVDASEADWIAQRLCQSMREAPPIPTDGDDLVYPTISVGLATMQEGQSPQELLDAAGLALHRAKDGGRNQVSR